MQFLLGIYAFVLGAAMGSFAGAVAWRLEKGRDFVRERSECEHCHHVLAWYDLVPVVSWLWLRGKCRYCRKPIALSMLLTEVSLGLVFAASFLLWPYGWGIAGVVLFAVWLLSLVLLTILFLYDMRHSLLPDAVVWPLAVLGAIGFCLVMLLRDVSLVQWPLEALLALLPVSGVYGLLYIVSNGRWIGFGDVKLGIFIGLILGWQGALLSLLVANYLGLFWVLPLILRKRLDKHTQMPFGPFLIVATVLVFLGGEPLVNWVIGILGV